MYVNNIVCTLGPEVLDYKVDLLLRFHVDHWWVVGLGFPGHWGPSDLHITNCVNERVVMHVCGREVLAE